MSMAQRVLRPIDQVADADIYFLASRARTKLTQEASQSDHDLRRLVSHANMLDNLMDTLVKNREARQKQRQEQILKQQLAARAAIKAKQHKQHARTLSACAQVEVVAMEIANDNDNFDNNAVPAGHIPIQAPLAVYHDDAIDNENESESSTEMALDSDSESDSDSDDAEYDYDYSAEEEVGRSNQEDLTVYYSENLPANANSANLSPGYNLHDLDMDMNEETDLDMDQFEVHKDLDLALGQAPVLVTM